MLKLDAPPYPVADLSAEWSRHLVESFKALTGDQISRTAGFRVSADDNGNMLVLHCILLRGDAEALALAISRDDRNTADRMVREISLWLESQPVADGYCVIYQWPKVTEDVTA